MSKTTLGWIFGIAVAVAVAIVAVTSLKAGLSYKTDMLKAGTDVATALFVVALFVERSTGAFYALIFGERERTANLNLVLATASSRQEAAVKVAEELGFKERLRVLIAFAAGLFVSVAGVRTLAGLLTLDIPETCAACGQPEGCTAAVLAACRSIQLFHTVDVLLTAGLIAGGSNGIAFIIQALKTMMSKPNGDKVAEVRMRTTTTS